MVACALLKLGEIEAISTLAKQLSMTDEKLALYNEEEEQQQKQIAFLSPET